MYSSSINVNYPAFSIELIESLEKLIIYHLENKYYLHCTYIYNTLEHFIDSSEKHNFNEVNNILKLFLNYSEEYCKSYIDDGVNENIIRTFSRVSEKIIIKYDILKQPLMVSSNNIYIYNNIFECIYKYFSYYSEHRIDKNPLILLDCNFCIYKGLIEKIDSSKSETLTNYLNDHLYSFFYEPRELCAKFVDAHNIRSACLSIMRICELYDLLISLNLSASITKYIEDIIYLGFYFASQNDKYSCDFMNEGAVNYIKRKLCGYKIYINSIDGIIFEIYIKSYSNKIDMTKSESFLFDLGELFHSNFNLNFNWQERKWNYSR